MRKFENQIRAYLLLAIFVIIFPFGSILTASEISNQLDKTRINFSKKAAICFVKIAKSMDKAVCHLAAHLDLKEAIDIKINSHFYDSRARRYFISFDGKLKYRGKLSFIVNKDDYYLSSDGLLTYDIELSNIKKNDKGIIFNFSGIFVVSIEDLAYKVSKDIPNFVAAGAFSPATDLLVTFFNGLNTSLIAEATAETLVKFSRVALTKLGADLINAAGKNNEVSKFIKASVKDGSITSFLALTIVKISATSIVKVYGASLGATVGSMVSPGVGTTMGAFFGSHIATMIAKTIVYKTMVEFPVKQSLRKILAYQQILQSRPTLKDAIVKVEKSTRLVINKINNDFSHNQFKVFDMVLKKIDSSLASDRIYFVPLLKKLKEILRFIIINKGDWYYAKRYYQLKAYVSEWGLENELQFNIKK